QRQRQRRFALGVGTRADRDQYLAAVRLVDAARVLAAVAVEDDQRGSYPQAQHAGDVARGAALQPHALAADERPGDVHACQGHGASSTPARATSTIRSISAGVIT